MRLVLLAAAFILAPPLAAQTRGSCAEGTATATLDDGDVRAGLFINGNLFFRSTSDATQYVVPAGSGKSPVYAANLWVGGTVDGEIRVAAAVYHEFSFRPGPLNGDGSVPNPADCSAYDRIFVVSAADVAVYDAGGAPTADLSDWPAAWGAEVLDGDGDLGNYNLAGGDRPKLYGTQTAFWVMNDAGGVAGFRSTPTPIGLEVQVTAAAFDTADPVFAQATLYRFRLVKRAPGVMADARVGFWVDTDLGNAADDYIGSDSTRGMAFSYNADNDDEGADGYGLNPPAVGFDWLSGIGSNMIIVKNPGIEPVFPVDHIAALHSMWRGGIPLTEGGWGYQTAGPVVTWAYPGDPVTDQFWSEENVGGTGNSATPGDRFSFVTTPDLTLAPGVPVDVVLALPFARGADRLDSVTRLRAADDAIQAAYDGGALFPVAGETAAPTASALALSTPRPNPTATGASVTLTLPAAGTVRVAVVDVLGREVAVVYAGALAAGATTLSLQAGLAPGVYAVIAETAGGRAVQRLTVAR